MDVSLTLASSLGRLGTESAFAVLARARELESQGKDIIHLEIGEPDFATPAHICEAAFSAINAGETGYCPSAGIPEFRDSIAEYLSQTRGVSLEGRSVLVANGAKPFLFFTVLATCEPGDEVIYPDPGFPIYESAIRYAGATPVPLPLYEEKDFSFDARDLSERINERTRLVIFNSPQNPTGGLVGKKEIGEAASLIRESGAWVLSDEVYSQIVYTDSFASIVSEPGMLERTVLLDGLSKTYSMTGWRCGFAAVPDLLLSPLERFFINSTSCVPPFVQRAGVAALTGSQDDPESMVAEFRLRRDIIVSGLNKIPGISCRIPQGAFYVFPNIASTGITADDLASRLLEEAGVALLSGSAFGQVGINNLRVSYASSMDNLIAALDRIEDFLRRV